MKKYLNYIILVALMTVTFACGNFGNTNVSPNGALVPVTATLLTNALSAMGLSQLGGQESTNYLYSSYYCQYMSQALYTDASRYGAVDPGWGIYATRIEDLQKIIDVNSNPATAASAVVSGSNNNQIAVARILKAYWMSILTDRFGDIPYSQANQSIPNPVYDTQLSIYTDLFKELKEAAAQFDAGATVQGDIVFGGDSTKWQKFANSWRIILGVRLSRVDAANGNIGKNAVLDVLNNLATNGGVFELTSDDMTITYPGSSAGFQNPWLGIGNDQVLCSTLADYVTNTSDDRRFSFGNPVSGTLIGMPPGLARADALAYTNNFPKESLVLADAYRKDVSPLVVLSSADVWLARAEAAHLGWTTENVNTCYQNGITRSWDRWRQASLYDANGNVTGPNPNLAAYLSSPDIALNGGAGGTYSDAEKIGIQRWLSFFPNGDQGWAEWRRTGYPSFVKSVKNDENNGLGIPQRYIYPTSEHGLNPVNWAAAKAAMGDDTRNTKVWWAK